MKKGTGGVPAGEKLRQTFTTSLVSQKTFAKQKVSFQALCSKKGTAESRRTVPAGSPGRVSEKEPDADCPTHVKIGFGSKVEHRNSFNEEIQR